MPRRKSHSMSSNASMEWHMKAPTATQAESRLVLDTREIHIYSLEKLEGAQMDEHYDSPSTLDPIKNISNTLRSPAPTWCGIISQCPSRLLFYSKKSKPISTPCSVSYHQAWYRAEKVTFLCIKSRYHSPQIALLSHNRAWVVCSCKLYTEHFSTLYNHYHIVPPKQSQNLLQYDIQ